MSSDHDHIHLFEIFIPLGIMAIFLFGLFQCGVKKQTTFSNASAWTAASSRMNLDYIVSVGDRKIQYLPPNEQKSAAECLTKLRQIRSNLSLEDGRDLDLIKFVETDHIRLQSRKPDASVRLQEARQFFTDVHAVTDRHSK